MREFKKNRSLQGKRALAIYKTLGILALLGITVALVHGAWGMYIKLTEASDAHEVAQKELARLSQQEQLVGASVSELSSKRGIETEVRARYGVVRPGEGEIQIIDMSPAPSEPTEAPRAWWSRVVRALFVW